MNFKALMNKINTSISYKIFIIGTISLILLILSVMWISNYYSIQEYNKEVVRNNRSSMQVARQYFDETMNRYDELLYSMLFDRQFVDSLYEHDSESENFGNQQYIISKMFNISNTDVDVIDGISVYTQWNNRLIEIPPNTSIVSFHYPEDDNFKSEDLGFYSDGYILRREMNDFYTGNYIATVSIFINWSSMNTALSLFEEENNNLFVISNNELVYPEVYPRENIERELISKSIMEDDVVFNVQESTNNFTFYQKISDDMYLLNEYEKNLTDEINRSFVDLSIFIIALAIVVYLLVIIYFNYSFIKPIKKLTKQMSKVKYGELNDIKFNNFSNKKDEVYQLNSHYQSMMNQIKYMMYRQYKYEMYTKQIQFQSLQSKINPHFLRNTLQVIGNHALSNEGELTYALINSLSNMFNYNLYDEKASTLVGEYENLKEYLAIQKARFPNKLALDLYFDSEVENVNIPILTLQPLVENAFQHGFKNKKGMWKLEVSVEKVFDDIIVTISDNGTGIDPKNLNEIKSKLNDRSTGIYNKDSIGMKNVDERLKIIFGEDNGLNIDNKVDGGVKITFSIPIDQEENDND